MNISLGKGQPYLRRLLIIRLVLFSFKVVAYRRLGGIFTGIESGCETRRCAPRRQNHFENRVRILTIGLRDLRLVNLTRCIG